MEKAGVNETKHIEPVFELKIKDLERAIRSSREAPVELAKREYYSSIMQLQVKEFEEVIKMRSHWSRFLMICVGVIILCQVGIFIAVGGGWLKFEDQWLARLLFPGTFIEILGFVYIIINYLFPTKFPGSLTT